jgi:hypothetical protein
MSSRVTTSANIVLGLDEMNAYGGSRDYEDVAIELGNNKTKYADVRRRLIDTALQENPLHRYWDMGRYVLNFEDGIMEAWGRFLAGLPPDHITVVESEEAQRGTFDDKLEFHPSDRHLSHDEL